MLLSPGTRIDRYEIEAPLGRGGMATVYRVRHTGLGSRHALKVLAAADAAQVRRLQREGRLQSALSHPNVLAVSDLVEVGGAPGLVLEYVAGWTLREALGHGRLTEAQVDWLARGILAGVAAAHAQGLVHRDLKPDNILLAWVDGQPVPKVADFGLAVLLEGGTRFTQGGLGTPGYMAPEQVVDAAAVDHRADVFALGAILYELVTGTVAFPGSNLFVMLERARNGGYRPPRQIAKALPEPWERAIVGALAPDPADRIATVEALAALWHEGPAHEPPEAWGFPEPEEAVWEGAVSTVGFGAHPPLDDLVDHPDRADVASHLEGCAECRVDRRLYVETFGPTAVLPKPPRWVPWQVGAGVGLASVPVVFGAIVVLFGDFRSLEEATPWVVGLAGTGGLAAGLTGAAATRALAGEPVGLGRWVLPWCGPPGIGLLGAALGLMAVTPLVEAWGRERVVAEGVPIALRVEWAGWALAAFGLLAAALVTGWARRGPVRPWPLVVAGVAGLGLWGAAIAAGTDSPGSFVGWAALVAVGGVAAAADGPRRWVPGVLGVLAMAALGRAAWVADLRAAPLDEHLVDAVLAWGWPAAAVACAVVGLARGPLAPPTWRDGVALGGLVVLPGLVWWVGTLFGALVTG